MEKLINTLVFFLWSHHRCFVLSRNLITSCPILLATILLAIDSNLSKCLAFAPLHLSRLAGVHSTSSGIQNLNTIQRDLHLNLEDADSSGDRIKGSTTVIASDDSKRRSRQGAEKNTNKYDSYNKKKKVGNKYKVRTMFREAKEMERTGQWHQACKQLEKILDIDPYDSYSHLALARLQSRRERSTSGEKRPSINNEKEAVMKTNGNSDLKDSRGDINPAAIAQTKPNSEARQAFYTGTEKCPESIHIWQAWALHEDSLGNISFARSLFQRALKIDDTNPYVCHGYGLLEHQCGNFDAAIELWQRPLKSRQKGKTTAALVCSLGKLMVAKGQLVEARKLYIENVLLIDSQREATEVYMAAAWLEEKHFKNFSRAEELLNLALKVSPGNSRATIALAKLAGRKIDAQRLKVGKNNINAEKKSSKQDVERRRNDAVKTRLQEACRSLVNGKREEKIIKSDVKDGRLFNAWAKLEVKDNCFEAARSILRQGMELFPYDHAVSSRIFVLKFKNLNISKHVSNIIECVHCMPSYAKLLGK